MTKPPFLNQVFKTIKKIRENRYYPLFLIILLIILVVWLACQWLRPLSVESAGTSADFGSVPSVPIQSSLETISEIGQNKLLKISEAALQKDSSSRESESSAMAGPHVGVPDSLAELEQMIETQSSSHTANKPHLVTLAVQPDPSIERGFLLVSNSETAARAFNSYFSFYFDWTEDGRTRLPTLILDRLFTDQNRDTAIADQSFSDPEVIHELHRWIDVLIHRESGQDICAFILACYRRDFANHLDATAEESIELWTESRDFGDLEVAFHADRENYCTFTVA